MQKTVTVTPEQVKAVSKKFNRGDFSGAQSSAIKMAVETKLPYWLYATNRGYVVTHIDPKSASLRSIKFTANGYTVTGEEIN